MCPGVVDLGIARHRRGLKGEVPRLLLWSGLKVFGVFFAPAEIGTGIAEKPIQ